MEIVLASAAIFVGCFFATVSGFGFALISTPLLSLVLSPKEAIIIIPLLTVLLRILTMYQVRKDFDGKTLAYISVGWIMGILPGSYVLKIISVAHLQVFLGVVLLGACWLMGKKYYVEIKNKNLGRIGAGFLAGFFGTSTSVAGPPMVLYFLNEKLDSTHMRANLIWVFGVGNLLITIMNFMCGNAKALGNINTVLMLVPTVMVAAYVGNKAFEHLNQELFRKLSLAIICVGGILVLYNGIRGSIS